MFYKINLQGGKEMKSRYYAFLFFALLIFGLSSVVGLPSITWGATSTVTVGCPDLVKCPAGIGYVDDTNGSGGRGVPAITNIAAGDTVQWHVEVIPHSVTSQEVLGARARAACGTGDTFDSGLLLTSGVTFSHVFPNPGRCAYFCTVHGVGPTGMEGEVVVGGVGATTTTSTPGATTTLVPGTTTTSIPGATTTSAPVTTTSAPVTTTSFPSTTSTTFNPNPTTTIVASTTTIRQTTTTNAGDGRGGGGRGGGDDGRGGGGRGR
jgi:plastocyanin